MIKVAINGFGRIGRNVLRAHYESGKKHGLQFVAINDLGDAATNAHLLKYDTVHGPFRQKVQVKENTIQVGDDSLQVVAERDPAKLPWKALGVDVVLECTGLFTSKAKAGAHLAAGAKKVLLTAPAKEGKPGETYNVGGNAERTTLEVVQTICRVLDEIRPKSSSYADLITYVKDRPGHDRRYAIDPAKIGRQLGWRPQETFETGLAKTVRWYLDNRDWWEPLRSNVYTGERLGLVPAASARAG